MQISSTSDFVSKVSKNADEENDYSSVSYDETEKSGLVSAVAETLNISDEEAEILLNYAKQELGSDVTIEEILETLFNIIDTDDDGDYDEGDDNISDLDITNYVILQLDVVAGDDGILDDTDAQALADLLGLPGEEGLQDAQSMITYAEGDVSKIAELLFDSNLDGVLTVSEVAKPDLNKREELEAAEAFFSAFFGSQETGVVGFVSTVDFNSPDAPEEIKTFLSEFFPDLNLTTRDIQGLIQDAVRSGQNPAEYIGAVFSQYILQKDDVTDNDGKVLSPRQAFDQIKMSVDYQIKTGQDDQLSYMQEQIKAQQKLLSNMTSSMETITKNIQNISSQISDMREDVVEDGEDS